MPEEQRLNSARPGVSSRNDWCVFYTLSKFNTFFAALFVSTPGSLRGLLKFESSTSLGEGYAVHRGEQFMKRSIPQRSTFLKVAVRVLWCVPICLLVAAAIFRSTNVTAQAAPATI